ncbi:MAG: hypothetical protein KGI54_13780 [Pseudomonadota bacterium]|nr:hypothetical protein [Pseudomonadota bacterium]
MPNIPLPDSVLIEALDLIEEYGNANAAIKAGATKLPRGTIRNRVQIARLKGLKPSFSKEQKRVYTKQRLGKMHLVIPDTQCKPGVNLDHLEHIGNFIVDKKPDNIIMIGDWWDMPSLSSYDRGKLAFEGRRYVDDIKAGRGGMERLHKPIDDYNRTAREKYDPEKDFTMGNHEQRIIRFVDENPELAGKLDYGDMGIQDWGWKVHDFLKPIERDGVLYCHYFTSGVRGNPVSSAAALLRERQQSAIMGHVQTTDIAVHKKTQQTAIFCGICYTHNEAYLGYQGNTTKRQILVLHEVEGGIFDMMFVSLKFLAKAYS